MDRNRPNPAAPTKLVAVIAALALAVVVLAAPAGADDPPPAAAEETANPWLDRRVLVIAHAGGEDENPHSTLYAYRRAHALGTDVLEGDVRITSDGVAVIHHDATVTATTGQPGTLSEMTYEQAHALDNAYRFTPYQWSCASCPVEDYIYRGMRTGDVAAPEGFEPDDFAISAVRRLFEEFPGTWLDLEIKGSGQIARDTADQVIALIEEFEAQDRVVLASFDSEIIDYIHEQYPEAITSPGEDELIQYAFFDGPLDRHKMVQVPPTYNGVDLVTPEFVDQMHGEGLAVWVWMDAKEQEDAAFYQGLIDMGVDALLVSRPSVARQVVDEAGAAWVPPAVPQAPTEVSVQPGATTATVSWLPPDDPGSADLSSYTVRAELMAIPAVPLLLERDVQPEVTVHGDVTQARIEGLDYGHLYRFEVVATNEVGDSEMAYSDIVRLGPPDVDPWHPFVDSIAWMLDEGLTTGDADGSFGPTRPTSRQAMAAFLWRLAGEPDPNPGPGIVEDFADVPPGHPFGDAIRWVGFEGIAEGYDDGTFRPGEPVSRQAAAVFLWRLAGEPMFIELGEPHGFIDVGPEEPFDWAITWMTHHAITTGYHDGTFRPLAPVSRQAMAVFLHRFSQLES